MRSAAAWRRWRWGAVVAVCCIVVPLLWWETKLGPIRPRGTVAHRSFDQYHYTLPALHYAASMLRQGIVPLWNPYQLCGTPFLAAQLHGILYPPNWLILVLPLPQALRLLLCVHAMLAMAGAYWCARVFGVGRPAALLAGVSYAFSGTLCVFAAGSMQPMFVSTAWLPWQLGLTRRTLARPQPWRGSAIALGAVYAMPVLGGHLPGLPLAIVLCGAYTLAALALTARQCGLTAAAHRGARLALAAAVMVGLSAVQLAPALELALRSPRQPGGLSSAWALNPLPDLLPLHEFLRGILVPQPGRLGLGGETHVGTAPLALALLPLLCAGTRRRALFFWVVGLGAALIALADATPVFRWYAQLPGAALFRIPQRFTAVATLCLALAGALGAEALSRRQRTWHVLISPLPGLLLVSGLGLLLRRADPTVDFADDAGLLLLRAHLVVVVGWILLFAVPSRIAGARWRATLVTAAALAGIAELYASSAVEWPTPLTYPDGLRLPTAAAAFIRERSGLARTFAPNMIGDFLAMMPLKLGALTGIQVISDYEPLVDERFVRLLQHAGDEVPTPGSALYGPQVSHLGPEQLPLLRLLGVGYVLVRHDAELPVALGPPLFDDNDYEVYAVPDPLPRAYVATRVQVAPTADGALDAVVRNPAFILDRGAIVEGSASASTGVVEVTHYRSHEVELHATLAQPGLVVLNDQYDPFWIASVDGHAATVLRTNAVFRGVVVPAGDHVVVFRYRPWLVYDGAVATLLTLGLVAVAMRSEHRARNSGL